MIGGVTERLAPDSDFLQWNNETNGSEVDVLSRDAERVRVAAAVTFLSGLFQTVIEICYLLPETNIGTLVVSVVTVIALIAAKEVNSLLSRKLPVPIPVELLAIIIATVISWQFTLDSRYGVEVVGQIPSGLQPPTLPTVSLFGQVLGDAFALSVVGYGIAISLGRIFALKYGYKVDSNQELVALGLSNTIGGVASALSALVILVILLKIGELFEQLPKAVLAAIIYVNLHGMMKQFADIPLLWRTNRVDMLVWVVTFILTVLFNPDLGLAASIAFSLLTVVFRTQLPQYSILGQVPGTDIYKPVEEYKMVKQVPDLVIFRSSATLYFANAEMYVDALAEKIRRDYGEIGVEVFLSGCQDCVLENLETGGFFNEKVTKAIIFSTVHDAVLHCQRDPSSQEMEGTHF
ncbi:hypothetical protein JZ751_021748 [Albula glossodonta]|uniref:SLC26A/SulP transporter domain-containing protein n=1 Tax=Albula glossodonta TaxID=121402 RepID=A0A8T2NMM6_9TELE|nr:hypothetical protein JZ751_021748 [Albula glossodonta]